MSMNRDDLEESFSQARTLVDIIRALAQGEMQTPGKPSASLYSFLADELDARFESIQVEIEAWDTPAAKPVPPAMPPLTEGEIAASADITKRLRAAIPLLRQSNLDRAVKLAHQAAQGQGSLVEHFAELGRRFGDERDQSGGAPSGPS